jgi:hypothetical protein
LGAVTKARRVRGSFGASLLLAKFVALEDDPCDGLISRITTYYNLTEWLMQVTNAGE